MAKHFGRLGALSRFEPRRANKVESISEKATYRDLVVILTRTAKAHHAATGGDNPDWPTWYAEHAVDEINELVGDEMSVSELADWLEAADRRYRAEEPGESWPRAYATWLLGGDD